jgi:hypothetical protein
LGLARCCCSDVPADASTNAIESEEAGDYTSSSVPCCCPTCIVLDGLSLGNTSFEICQLQRGGVLDVEEIILGAYDVVLGSHHVSFGGAYAIRLDVARSRLGKDWADDATKRHAEHGGSHE